MLQFNTVDVILEEKAILKDIYFESACRSICLLGPTGCGKSTLLKTLMGIYPPKKGQVCYDQVILSENGNIKVKPEKRPFKFLLQEESLFDHLNVFENIQLGRHALKANSNANQKMQELIEMFALSSLLERRIHGLSGGERQRVALARTLLASDKMVLLDEPFSNIDALTKELVLPKLKAWLEKEQLRSFTVTHDKQEAYYLGEEWLLLKDGEVVQQGEPETLYRKSNNRWVAEFMGKLNILSSEDKELLNCPDEMEWCRPEELSLSLSEQGNGEIVNSVFEGRVRCLQIQLSNETIVMVDVPQNQSFSYGDSVQVLFIPESRSF